MINLLLGAPGGGKSYEAVTYHVLPALKRGRKVITNLPLNVEAFEALDPDYPALIELRTATLAEAPAAAPEGGDEGVMGLIRQARAMKFDARAFANVEDFESSWKSADGQGPLYVIDECHFVMPKGGTARGVEEWFSMHRHFNADVLLITQSSGKISVSIKDLVQVCYKVRKAIAFGKPDSYIRKVLDGVNGGEVSVSERKYKPQMFKLYRSHTQGVSIGEADADDVKPFIVKFRVFTWVVLGVGVIASVSVLGMIFWPKPVKAVTSRAVAPVDVKHTAPDGTVFYTKGIDVPLSLPLVAASAPVVASALPAGFGVVSPSGEFITPEPFASKSLHLTGHLKMGAKTIYTFAVSQNGLIISSVKSDELERAGYRWVPLFDCAGSLVWRDRVQAVTCDVPQIMQGMVKPAGSGSSPVVAAGVREAEIISKPSLTDKQIGAAARPVS